MLHIHVGLVQGSDPQRCQSLCQREREKWRVFHWQVDALVCKWHAPLSLKIHWPEWVTGPLSSYSGVRMSHQLSAQEGRIWRFSSRCGRRLTWKLDLGSCRLLTPSLDSRTCVPLAFPVPETAQGQSWDREVQLRPSGWCMWLNLVTASIQILRLWASLVVQW